MRGKQPIIDSAGKNKRVPVFGGLDALSGRLHILATESKCGADFIAFLKLLFRRYAGRHIFLFLDNCSIHHSKLVRRFLADHLDQITLIWNATYCPELNLIERYWGYLKTSAINNYLFESVDALRHAVRDAVGRMNRSKTLRIELQGKYLQKLRGAA